jgi:hypothetical protein
MSSRYRNLLGVIIGSVIVLVVAGGVISTFLSMFQSTPREGYSIVLNSREISRQCTSKCADYKDATGTKAQWAAIDYCISNFHVDWNEDGSVAGTAGTGYNRYCEDGTKCFNIHTCEYNSTKSNTSTTLNPETCAEIMFNYYTSPQIGQNASEANKSINNLYNPENDPKGRDRTIGTCGLDEVNGPTWWSENFNRSTQ